MESSSPSLRPVTRFVYAVNRRLFPCPSAGADALPAPLRRNGQGQTAGAGPHKTGPVFSVRPADATRRAA